MLAGKRWNTDGVLSAYHVRLREGGEKRGKSNRSSCRDVLIYVARMRFVIISRATFLIYNCISDYPSIWLLTSSRYFYFPPSLSLFFPSCLLVSSTKWGVCRKMRAACKSRRLRWGGHFRVPIIPRTHKPLIWSS